jgi:hypothetical protein
MPQILIVTDDSEETARTVVYRLEHADAQGVIVTRPKAVRPST